MEQTDLFGTEKISRILFRLAPPVMLAQLIQALYNIVDSFFVGKYSASGLTALSIIYPMQLLMIAFAVGTGVGINTVMAAKLGTGNRREADEYAGVGTPLAVVLWFLFAAVCYFIMPFYARMSTDSEVVIQDVITYGRIVCVFSFGLFLESIWTKVLQSNGDMKTPMFAQILGAVTNIVLDPLLIFGLLGLPVFTQGGGIGYVLQPSFGFLLGLIPAAAVIGALTARRTGYLTVLAAVLVGDLILYAVGVPYMYLILHVYMQSAKTFPALLAAMLVYVPGDTLKIVVVTALAPVLRRTLAKAVPNL
mgnify:CR=1 FL=1